MRDELADGWKISQVETLTGLPRRDIQRACYEGPGGLGVVRPRNTTWGWRSYDAADVAKLFLVAQERRRSRTLEEACRKVASGKSESGLTQMLELCGQRARDARGEEAGAFAAACALRCALAHEGASIFAGLIDALFAESFQCECDVRTVLELAAKGLLSGMLEELASVRGAGAQPNSEEAARICRQTAEECARACWGELRDACNLLVQAVNASGMALVCELWLGPSAHAFANAALEAAFVEMEESASDGRDE